MIRGRYTYANLSFWNRTFLYSITMTMTIPEDLYVSPFVPLAPGADDGASKFAPAAVSKSDTFIISPSAYGFSSILVTFVHDLTTVFPSEAMSLPSIKPLRTAMVAANVMFDH